MKEELCEKMVEVRRLSDRVMTVSVVFEEDVLRLICGYVPQCGRCLVEKHSFYEEMKGEWDRHNEDDLVVFG